MVTYGIIVEKAKASRCQQLKIINFQKPFSDPSVKNQDVDNY